jgi:hypothetical protein
VLQLTVTAHLLGLRLHDTYRHRRNMLRNPADRDRGDIVQTVIIIAVLAGLAIAVLAVIVVKVTNWGNKVPDTTQNPNGG